MVEAPHPKRTVINVHLKERIVATKVRAFAAKAGDHPAPTAAAPSQGGGREGKYNYEHADQSVDRAGEVAPEDNGRIEGSHRGTEGGACDPDCKPTTYVRLAFW